MIEHVEFEFFRADYDPTNHTITEIMIELGVAYSFSCVLPAIIAMFVVTSALRIYYCSTYRLTYCARRLETARFSIPFIRETFMVVFFSGTVINFVYFYSFFVHFSTALELVGIDVSDNRRVKMGFLLTLEHILLFVFFFINYILKDKHHVDVQRIVNSIDTYLAKKAT